MEPPPQCHERIRPRTLKKQHMRCLSLNLCIAESTRPLSVLDPICRD